MATCFPPTTDLPCLLGDQAKKKPSITCMKHSTGHSADFVLLFFILTRCGTQPPVRCKGTASWTAPPSVITRQVDREDFGSCRDTLKYVCTLLADASASVGPVAKRTFEFVVRRDWQLTRPNCMASRLCHRRVRAHVFQHMCAWCRYTRGRFERTHGGVSESTYRAAHTHRTHQTHTTTTATTRLKQFARPSFFFALQDDG